MNLIKLKNTSKEYHESEHLGKSNLFKMAQSPEIFKHFLETPTQQSDALLFGSAFHSYCLEPETFDKYYAIMPKFNLTTKDGKNTYCEWLNYHFDCKANNISNKIIIDSPEKMEHIKIITNEDFIKIKAMTDSVMNNKYAKYLLTGGEVEQSYYWTDEITNVKVKCRPDIRKDGKTASFITDLKSCNSACNNAFERDIFKYGYHLQAAQYKEGVELFENKLHSFMFVAVEKTAPYAVNVIDIDDVLYGEQQAADVGLDLYRELLGRVAECRFTGNWYGYCGDDLMPNVSQTLLNELEQI